MLDYKLIIEKAKELGFEDFEIIEKKSSSLAIKLFNGYVDQNKISGNSSISIRGLLNEKMANINIENLDINVDEVLLKLKNNALSLESNEKYEIYGGSSSYPEVEENNFDFDSIPVSKKIDLLKKLEETCKSLDNRVVAVSHCAYQEIVDSYHIINSKGLDIEKNKKLCALVVGVVALEEGEHADGFNVCAKNTFDELDVNEVAKKAVTKAVGMLKGKQIKTDNYKVIFENGAMSSILSAFHGMFSGTSAVQKITPLIGKEGSQIMSSKITIIDNPLHSNAIVKDAFDDEGVACYEKEIVKDGVLKTLLHSLGTAKFFNTSSTGNGFASNRGGISASGRNFYIKKGSLSKEELIASLDKGLLITDVEGLHSGVNPISGDFSVKASGFYIEDGKINKPVTLLVISGNFIKMMNEVIEVGSDLEFGLDDVISPSILFNYLPVSGE